MIKEFFRDFIKILVRNNEPDSCAYLIARVKPWLDFFFSLFTAKMLVIGIYMKVDCRDFEDVELKMSR